MLRLLKPLVNARLWCCSIEEDTAFLPFPDEAPDDFDALHELHKPFTRDDKYGVAGWHGPPFTAIQVIRIAVKLIMITALVLSYAFVLMASIFLLLGNGSANRVMSRCTPTYTRILLWFIGFQPVRIVRQDGRMQEEEPAAPVLVVNHVSWLDVPILTASFFPSFVAKESVRELPIWGRLAVVMRCLFVPRGRTGASSALIARIRAQHTNHRQILVFPEGTTTNGSHLLPFRTGAFAAGLPVQPILLQYETSDFNPSWESIGFKTHLFCLLAQPFHRCTVTLLPPIQPPKLLVDAIQNGTSECDEAKASVQAFAKEAHDAIARAGQLESSKLTYKEKVVYHTSLRQRGYH